jgi:type II secretory pathway pseudopilin PulG
MIRGPGHPGRRNAGFTLLEVVLAIGLIVSLMGSAIWFTNRIASARDKINEKTQEIVSRRSLMNRMTKELRCAMSMRRLGLGIAGEADYVAFVTTTVPGRSVWVDRNILDQPIPPETDIQLITYRQAIREDEDGEEYIVGIERTCQKLLDAPEAEEGENIQVALITDKLKYLRLSYYDGEAWTKVWTATQGLPLAIEITLGDEPVYEDKTTDMELEDEEPEDYIGQASRRMIHLPLSVMKTQGTIIRGGPGGGGR